MCDGLEARTFTGLTAAKFSMGGGQRLKRVCGVLERRASREKEQSQAEPRPHPRV